MHVVVHGRVQGVGFRYSARAEAVRLGVSGWVRNRVDGAVEAEISGDEAQLERMLRWLSRGPFGAEVTSLETTELAQTNQVAQSAAAQAFRITE